MSRGIASTVVIAAIWNERLRSSGMVEGLVSRKKHQMRPASCGLRQRLSAKRTTPNPVSRCFRMHQVPITARLIASADGLERTTMTSLLASKKAMRIALAVGARSRQKSHAKKAERMRPKVLAIIQRTKAARQGSRANGRVTTKAVGG
jgi:hypothetical protein